MISELIMLDCRVLLTLRSRILVLLKCLQQLLSSLCIALALRSCSNRPCSLITHHLALC